MSQVRSNQPIVGSSTYAPGQTVTTSNLGYNATGAAYAAQPATTTYTTTQGGATYAGQGATTYVTQPGTTSYEYSNGPQYANTAVSQYAVANGSGVALAGQKAVAADIPVESRIEYIPFEKKYVEYEQVEKIFQVPVEYEDVEYEEVVSNERVPYERTITDYYAVETQVEYIRREVEETVMVEEPVERTYERVQYIPVETQVVHYPERDNYVAAPTKTRTEYIGQVDAAYANELRQGGSTYQGASVVQGGATYVQGGNTTNTYAKPVASSSYQTYTNAPAVETRYESRPVETRYENRPIETRVANTTYVSNGSNVVESSGANYTTTQNYPVSSGYANNTTTTTYVAPSSTSYQTGYVTGGSGVRQGNGYVTGGSGVKGASYETRI